MKGLRCSRLKGIKRYTGYVHLLLMDSLAFKTNLLSTFLASIIEFIVMLCIWISVFHSKSTIEGFSFPEMITYLCVAQGITAIYGWSNSIEGWVYERIHEGNIVFDLLKPVRFNFARIAEGIGSSILQISFVMILMTVLMILIPEFKGPRSLSCLACFILSVGIGYFIMSFISLIIGLSSFFLMSYWGIYYLKKAIIDLFSGSLAPLALLPGWMQSISAVLPFSKIVYTPVMIYMGRLSGQALVQAIFVQLLWCLVLFLMSEALYRIAIRKVTINGG